MKKVTEPDFWKKNFLARFWPKSAQNGHFWAIFGLWQKWNHKFFLISCIMLGSNIGKHLQKTVCAEKIFCSRYSSWKRYRVSCPKTLTCRRTFKLNIFAYQLILLSLAINCGMQACWDILKDIKVSSLNVLGDHFFIRLTFMINVWNMAGCLTCTYQQKIYDFFISVHSCLQSGKQFDDKYLHSYV